MHFIACWQKLFLSLVVLHFNDVYQKKGFRVLKIPLAFRRSLPLNVSPREVSVHPTNHPLQQVPHVLQFLVATAALSSRNVVGGGIFSIFLHVYSSLAVFSPFTVSVMNCRGMGLLNFKATLRFCLKVPSSLHFLIGSVTFL